MRLIDADKLPIHKAYCIDETGYGANLYVVDKSDIDNAPTVSDVDKDVCEWKLTMSGYESCRKYGEAGHLIYHYRVRYFKYCPYCGKKIKVV